MDKGSLIDVAKAFAIALVAITAFVGWFWIFIALSKTILRRWAGENGFQIISFEQRYLFFTGPFKWWSNGRGQFVYRVVIRDRDGHERSGWVRCGSYLGGVLFNNDVEVRWEEK